METATCAAARPPDPNGAVGPESCGDDGQLCISRSSTRAGHRSSVRQRTTRSGRGFGGDCQTDNAGDPVVLYDQLADRWILTQFTSSGPTFFECVAVSQTNDPTGSYFRYAISTGNNFPDYPKGGVWPDAYYFSTREFLMATAILPASARMRWIVPRLWLVILIRRLWDSLRRQIPHYVVGDGLLPSSTGWTDAAACGKPELLCRFTG